MKLPILSLALALTGCTTAPTTFLVDAPVTRALPLSSGSVASNGGWTDFITPSVTFDWRDNSIYDVWISPNQSTVLSFLPGERIKSKTISDNQFWFLAEAQPNLYQPNTAQIAVFATAPNKQAMLDVFTQTRHYRIRLKSIDGKTYNASVNWQTQPINTKISAFKKTPAPTLDGPKRLVKVSSSTANSIVDVPKTPPKSLTNSPTSENAPLSSSKKTGLTKWTLKPGQTLQEVLTNWSVIAKYRVRMMPNSVWRIEFSGSYSGEFVDALDWLLAGFAESNPRPTAVLHSNNVIEIKEQYK